MFASCHNTKHSTEQVVTYKSQENLLAKQLFHSFGAHTGQTSVSVLASHVPHAHYTSLGYVRANASDSCPF